MKLRSTLLTVLAFLALVLGGVVNAQDDMGFDPCFGLAEADCAVINEASANGLGDAESFTVDVSIEFSGSELSSLFDLAAGFAPDADLEAVEAINEATFSFDGTFDVVLGEDEETPPNVSGSLTVTYSQDGGDVTEMSYDVMLVGTTLYGNDGSGWKSVDLMRLAEDDTVGSLMDMTGMDMGGEDTEEDVVSEAFDFSALVGILNLPGFLTYERNGDDFVFNIDFSVLQQLLEEENEDLLNELVMTASEVDPSMAFFVPLIPTLISDGNINVVQSIDADANIVTGIAVDADLSLALGIMAGSDAVTDVSLDVNIAFSNLNGVTASAAPDGAEDATDMVIAWLEQMAAAAEDAGE